MNPLDNPIWHALNTSHAHFAATCGLARRFPSEVSVLGGFAEPSPDNYAFLASLLKPGERVGLFLPDPPEPPPGWTVVSTGPLAQMVYSRSRGSVPVNHACATEFVPLTKADVPEMLALTKLTKPGPFSGRTYEMGEYLGIRIGGVLVAMAGERLRLPDYTEISAVCTHPDHLGHGYATALVTTLMERICARGDEPILHVRSENTRAVALYEHLGFEQRKTLQYAVLHV
jgi:predicted GNAT family acetyltransferase